MRVQRRGGVGDGVRLRPKDVDVVRRAVMGERIFDPWVSLISKTWA